jgi:hypothetical protein
VSGAGQGTPKPLNEDTNASRWASEFIAACPAVEMDHATLTGWFANAIMCGYDAAMRRIS